MTRNPFPDPASSDPEDTSRFARFALLGHDLRAAVSDVLGGIRLIDQDRLDPATRLQLDRVRSAGEEMARLLEDGIALAAEHSGQDGHHPVQTSRFFHEIGQRWAGRARERDMVLDVAIGAEVPAVLLVDRAAIERLLGNLLSNALKYGNGMVRVQIDAPQPDRLRIEVSDDGPGFPADALAHLFAPGRRGSNTLGHPGHGLGMFIARSMAERLEGRIEVANRATGGACVTVETPLRHPLARIADPDSDLGRMPDLGRMNVLVVEDSHLSRLLTGQMLAAMGADHDIAEDGLGALDLLDENVYDFAIVDVEMPRMSGVALVEALRRSHDRHRALPIVACTAYALRANRDAILAAGADAIVTKPLLDPGALGTAIVTALRAHGREVALPAGVATAEATPSSATGAMQIEKLLADRDADSVRPILTDLVSDLVAVERALAAAQAGPDFARISAEAHKLLAIAGTIGADRIATLADGMLTASTQRDRAQVMRHLPRLMAKIDRLILRVGDRLHALPGGAAP